jgi:hypothetical protein
VDGENEASHLGYSARIGNSGGSGFGVHDIGLYGLLRNGGSRSALFTADTSAMEKIKISRDIFSPAVEASSVFSLLEDSGADYLFVDSGKPLTHDFFGVNSQQTGPDAVERFDSFDFLHEIGSAVGMKLYSIGGEQSSRGDGRGNFASYPADERTESSGSGFGAGFEAGEGIVLEGAALNRFFLEPGDSMTISIRWSACREIDFGLPVYWTLRFDTEFEKGPFYRRWYGKQYRRAVERKRGELYRYTVSGRVIGAGMQPDMWVPGSTVGQRVSIRMPEGMAEGGYVVRLTVHRRAYIPNRHIKDYFLNEDSFQGRVIAELDIGESRKR